MPRNSCSRPRPTHTNTSRPAPGSCVTTRATEGSNLITSAAHNLRLDELASRLGTLGPLEKQKGYCYVVRTVTLVDGTLVQTASAPNFDGGHITLCTCKHSMRATLPVEAWLEGVWIAGMNSWNIEFRKQQGLVYLMRVGEAYASHFELVTTLRNTGRSVTVEMKAATHNRCGDLMIPKSDHLVPDEYRSISAYALPMVGHAHRKNADHTHWENDITHVSSKGIPASLLVGDPAFSFTWSKQMLRNTKPGTLRPYRPWDLGTLLSNLEEFPA